MFLHRRGLGLTEIPRGNQVHRRILDCIPGEPPKIGVPKASSREDQNVDVRANFEQRRLTGIRSDDLAINPDFAHPLKEKVHLRAQ
jgi:hypothetical protein